MSKRKRIVNAQFSVRKDETYWDVVVLHQSEGTLSKLIEALLDLYATDENVHRLADVALSDLSAEESNQLMSRLKNMQNTVQDLLYYGKEVENTARSGEEALTNDENDMRKELESMKLTQERILQLLEGGTPKPVEKEQGILSNLLEVSKAVEENESPAASEPEVELDEVKESIPLPVIEDVEEDNDDSEDEEVLDMSIDDMLGGLNMKF